MINIKNKLKSYYKENKHNIKFRKTYQNLNKKRKEYNTNFIQGELIEAKELLNDICGYSLDDKQRQIVLQDEEKTLVIAGAGSGKTLTIIGKIRYLIERKKIKPNDILCISFTNEATKSLKEKLKKYYNYDIDVKTFHKLALDIVRKEKDILIANSDLLEYLINEYFIINNTLNKYLAIYFGIKIDEFNKYIKNNPYKLEKLKKLILTFIHLYKANYNNLDYYQKLINKKIFTKKQYKQKIFFKITYQIHKLYMEELKANNEIDFDDMLHIATKIVNEKGLNKKYKYIIIDEYQDTSYVRFLLISAILKSTNAHLLAVGDDFQSIYRFTGCNINIFLKFKKLFDDSVIMKIENTYRNPMELISIAGNFIMKNKKQMKKKLYSNIHTDFPIIIAYYNNKKQVFKKLIEHIYNESKKEIMILGRNNKDIHDVLDTNFLLEQDGTIIYLKNRNIKLKYYTVHKSKGLEASNVIIINMEDKTLGFPSQIEEDEILKYILKENNYYPFEEERRLFYVALTRTKNKVYLMSPYNRPSIFINELLKNYAIKKWD